MTTSLQQKITEQGTKIRELKASGADKDLIATQVQLLLELKKQAAGSTNEPTTGKGKKFILKTPKGTKDYNEKEMAIRELIFSTVTGIFKKHGAVTIDTPVFELKEILAGKYGEDSKLIYDLEDQGGEKCSLRYDLTVPFARYLAMHGTANQSIKRYQLGKVYRRDQPAMTKGRMREFYQCDFDIAGVFEPMVPDAEAVRIMVEALDALNIGGYLVKINHRKVLDGIFSVCGVPLEQIRPISSSVDKLDKLSWEEVKKEMCEEKNLEPGIADRIGQYVKLKGGEELLAKLREDANLCSSPAAVEGLADLKLLFDYLKVFKVLDRVSFDLSLARGLDYYTGVIYEAVLLNQPTEELKVIPTTTSSTAATAATAAAAAAAEGEEEATIGSIAAGGRYDELVGIFSGVGGASKKPFKVPCVGLSIGIERVFSILLRKAAKEEVKSNACEVYVISVGDGLLTERMELCCELWDNGIAAEYMYKAKPKLQPQFNVCDRDLIPLAVIIGRDELNNGMVKLKDMRSKTSDGEHGGVLIPRIEMISAIKQKLSSKV